MLPFAPDAWIDEEEVQGGLRDSLHPVFFTSTSPQASAEIMQEILAIEAELDGALAEVFGA